MNFMTMDTMLMLNIQTSLRHATTFLQLYDSSSFSPYGILEYIIVSIDSLKYPIVLIVLETKSKLSGYPLILGRAWIATTDAYIGCGMGDMTIINGPP